MSSIANGRDPDPPLPTTSLRTHYTHLSSILRVLPTLNPDGQAPDAIRPDRVLLGFAHDGQLEAYPLGHAPPHALKLLANKTTGLYISGHGVEEAVQDIFKCVFELWAAALPDGRSMEGRGTEGRGKGSEGVLIEERGNEGGREEWGNGHGFVTAMPVLLRNFNFGVDGMVSFVPATPLVVRLHKFIAGRIKDVEEMVMGDVQHGDGEVGDDDDRAEVHNAAGDDDISEDTNDIIDNHDDRAAQGAAAPAPAPAPPIPPPPEIFLSSRYFESSFIIADVTRWEEWKVGNPGREGTARMRVRVVCRPSCFPEGLEGLEGECENRWREVEDARNGGEVWVERTMELWRAVGMMLTVEVAGWGGH